MREENAREVTRARGEVGDGEEYGLGYACTATFRERTRAAQAPERTLALILLKITAFRRLSFTSDLYTESRSSEEFGRSSGRSSSIQRTTHFSPASLLGFWLFSLLR